MDWDENLGKPTFLGGIPLDTSAQLKIGEHVAIRKGDVQYEIALTDVSTVGLSGIVHLVEPPSAPNTPSIKPGDRVSFNRNHIFTVYRQ